MIWLERSQIGYLSVAPEGGMNNILVSREALPSDNVTHFVRVLSHALLASQSAEVNELPSLPAKGMEYCVSREERIPNNLPTIVQGNGVRAGASEGSEVGHLPVLP